jgi:hypothetical protein
LWCSGLTVLEFDSVQVAVCGKVGTASITRPKTQDSTVSLEDSTVIVVVRAGLTHMTWRVLKFCAIGLNVRYDSLSHPKQTCRVGCVHRFGANGGHSPPYKGNSFELESHVRKPWWSVSAPRGFGQTVHFSPRAVLIPGFISDMVASVSQQKSKQS